MKTDKEIEELINKQLLKRGFTKKRLLNNRGLIGAVIDELFMDREAEYIEIIRSLHDISGKLQKRIGQIDEIKEQQESEPDKAAEEVLKKHLEDIYVFGNPVYHDERCKVAIIKAMIEFANSKQDK